MVEKIRIQHYVPRFYLKNFSMKMGKNYYLNCFDKTSSKKFCTDIRKICCEKFFYDVPQDISQSVEKMLASFESKFNVVYNKIINTENICSLTDEERKTFALFIVIQWLRTLEERNIIKDTIKQLTEKLSSEKLSYELEQQLKEANTEVFLKNLHLNMFEDAPKFASIILGMKWVLFKNKTHIPYWTSDHPVNLYNNIDSWPYGNLGLRCKGIQIYFPLNSWLSVCLCDPLMYDILSVKYEIQDIQNIIFQNHLQVKWSTRHIISINNDFALAEQMIKENSELKEVVRKRISID